MGSILGDFFKDIGSGIDKVSDGEILDGVSDIIGGTLAGAGRTIGFTAKTIGDAALSVGNLINDIFGDGEVSQDEISEENLPLLGWITHIGMLAKMAKLDGRVSREEIEFMENLISDWNMDEESVSVVHGIFREARDSSQSIFDLAQIFSRAKQDDVDARIAVYVQLWRMALADASGAEEKLMVLKALPGALGLKDEIYDEVVARLEAGQCHGDDQQTLEESYVVLGCSSEADDAEVRRCYKEKMAQYHPDAISGKDLAPGFVECANRESAKINAAYEAIRKARGMR